MDHGRKVMVICAIIVRRGMKGEFLGHDSALTSHVKHKVEDPYIGEIQLLLWA